MSDTLYYLAAIEKYSQSRQWNESTRNAVYQIALRRWNLAIPGKDSMITETEKSHPEIWFPVYIALSDISFCSANSWISGFSRKHPFFDEVIQLAQQRNIHLTVLDKKCLCYMMWTCSSIPKTPQSLIKLMDHPSDLECVALLSIAKGGKNNFTTKINRPEWLPECFKWLYLSEEFRGKLEKIFKYAYEVKNSKSETLRDNLSKENCFLFRITSLAYEKDFPRQEAFENVITAFRGESCRLIYYLRGTGKGVEFYLGLTGAGVAYKADRFKSIFKGNFPGSIVKETQDHELKELLTAFNSEDLEIHPLVGVPSRNSDKDNLIFQGVERLINSMTDRTEDFHIVLVCEPIDNFSLRKYEETCRNLYSKLYVNSHFTFSHTFKKKDKEEDFLSEYGVDSRDNFMKLWNKKEDRQTSFQYIEKTYIDYAERLDKFILPRIQQGYGKGMYRTAVYVGAKNLVNQLSNTLISITQGNSPIPLKHVEGDVKKIVSSFCIPFLPCEGISVTEMPAHTLAQALESRPIESKDGRSGISLGTWLTASEVSILAGLPQKEVLGLELTERVEFGLNIPKVEGLKLGHIYQDGSRLEHCDVVLDKEVLSKHIFIAGTTGSGKTSTCLKLLAAAENIPFWVIEPAKTEYRALLNCPDFKNLLIFTAGDERGVPFRLNPFEFLEEESISGHIDMLKACFMASFDMEAAIPNILEEGLYAVYEEKGWDYKTNENRFLKNRKEAWFCGGLYFPTLSQYIETVLELIDKKGFDSRLRDDYKGSIRARLDSLCAGVKGAMFDTPLSVDFMDLLKKNVILEMEELKSPESKSFLMALILGRLTECLKAQHKKQKEFRHITLIEEAHRLLSRPQHGDSPSRKQGVEIFSDLLAEVRKYGEGFIIVDQIPAKLTPDVLKNTNTKIIHKIFARDDKEAVGDTMALDDRQKNYLSQLGTGDAIIFSQGWKKPAHVYIEEHPDVKTSDGDIDNKKVAEPGRNYWKKNAHIFCPFLAECSSRSISSWEELEKLDLFYRDVSTALKKDEASPPYDIIASYRKKFGGKTKDYLTALLRYMALKKLPQRAERIRQKDTFSKYAENLLAANKGWKDLSLQLSTLI